MSEMIVKRENLQRVADKIKAKVGTTGELVFPEGFENAVDGISGGGVIEPFEITENGTYTPPEGVDGYAPVTVNVGEVGGGSDPSVVFNQTIAPTKATLHNWDRILDNLFKDQITLKTVEFENSPFTVINSYAFYNCYSLVSISLPDSLINIGGSAFYNCSSLALTTLPKNLKWIESNAFEKCSELAITSLPDTLTQIKQSAFTGCKKLALTSLNDALTEVSTNVFNGCTQITTMDVRNVKTIGANAFRLTSLNTIILRSAESICALSNISAFTSTPFADGGTGGVALVPTALVEGFQTATNWSALYEAGNCTFLPLEDYTVDGTTTGEINWEKVDAKLDELYGGADA